MTLFDESARALAFSRAVLPRQPSRRVTGLRVHRFAAFALAVYSH
jgi:hypothetical protein